MVVGTAEWNLNRHDTTSCNNAMIISVVIIIYSTIIYQCQTKRARVDYERTRTAVSHCFIYPLPPTRTWGFPIGRHRNRRKNTLTIISRRGYSSGRMSGKNRTKTNAKNNLKKIIHAVRLFGGT